MKKRLVLSLFLLLLPVIAFSQNAMVREFSCSDAGANDTYACDLAVAPSGYVTGQRYYFLANTANTGAATINLNSLGAKTIKKAAGGITTDLADNDIRAGQWVIVMYDGTNMQMQSLLGNAPSGSGTVTSVATTSPITGGTITGTGTIACATCTTAASALTSGKVIEGAGSQAMAVSSLTATVVKSASGTLSAATAGTDYTSPSSTESFTNKTYDVEGTGNSFSTYSEDWFEAAGCNNATASLIFNSNTANAPAATCEGTNTRLATADFDDTTDEGFDGSFRLPTGFTGAIDFILRWKAAATSNAVGWCVQLVRIPTGSTSDPSLPAQASGNCVSTTTAGTTLQETESTISNVTCSSCAAGDRINFHVSRDANGGAVTDSMTGDAKLIGFMRRVRRTM